MKKFKKIPTIIGVLVLVSAIAGGVFLVQRTQVFRLGAQSEIAPQDIRVLNLTGTSFSVSWSTKKETDGFVAWGESQSLGKVAQDEGKDKTIHFTTIQNLTANTTYFFKINSNGQEFDNNGLVWEATTGAILPASTTSNVLSGTVHTATGEPAAGAVVIVSAGDISPLATLTSSSGNWIIPLSTARTTDLSAYASISQQAPLLNILVQGGNSGLGSAKVYPGSTNPTPTIILGQSHDFRSEPANKDTTLPKTLLQLPENLSNESGFEVPEGQPANPSSETVTLQSVTEGEVVLTTNPEFFGSGPVGTEITIILESDPTTDFISVDTNGNWQWNPPEGLTEGTHKITLSWRDESGILRKITRNFVVAAAEGPAFEATPSASSPAPTATPKATASPSSAPRVSLPSTESGTPTAGTLTPTLELSIMGLGLLAISFVIGKRAFSQ